ncbi:uncharacterized protein PAC_00928 [Phialocephala subalpina]|uniref:Rhodopsin domain-containing protein n=1 Tax=Phialocephala subalpina TaxID=576137 RepID=A0A1L7WE50_9HELO|nr:uncharacterized protein PAC_00928 [Phialocephala subalpina]
MFDSLQSSCYGVATAFFVICTITILLRLYSRSFLVKSFGWDDWCMFAILFFNCGQQAILYYFIYNGAGLHIDVVLETVPNWLVNLTNALFVEEIYYVWMHWVVKTAFLLFYLRFAVKGFRVLVFCTMGLNTLFTVITWLVYCFQCIPLDAFFNKAAHPEVKCLDNSILAFVPAAFSILIDIFIVILPIRPLWEIQVSLRKRLTLISIVSLGGIVVVISLVRLIVLREFQKGTDFTYTLGKLIIISSIEIEVAIMVANGPSLKIFWAKYISKTTPTEKDQSDGSNTVTDMSSVQRRRKLYSTSSCYVGSNCSPQSPIQEGDIETTEGLHSHSEEALWKVESGIIVTSSVGVEFHAGRGPQDTSATYNQFDKD